MLGVTDKEVVTANYDCYKDIDDAEAHRWNETAKDRFTWAVIHNMAIDHLRSNNC